MTEFDKQNVVFDNVDNLIHYLYDRHGELTPIKLQKGLYFLYAYYGATYGETKETDGVLEQNFDDFPTRLFDEEFEAWTYGPVIREVWRKHKAGEYGSNEPVLTGIKQEILLFIDELFEQIKSVSDFSLVDRSHEDEVWIDAYNSGVNNKTLDNDELIKEYKEKYLY